jgi:hypothetical protein
MFNPEKEFDILSSNTADLSGGGESESEVGWRDRRTGDWESIERR